MRREAVGGGLLRDVLAGRGTLGVVTSSGASLSETRSTESIRCDRFPWRTDKQGGSGEAGRGGRRGGVSSSGGAKGGGQKFVSAETAAQRDVNRRMTQTTIVRLKRRLQKTEMGTATARLENTRACRGMDEDKLSTVNLRSSDVCTTRRG